MSEPTVTELVTAAVAQANGALTEEAIRKLIRTNKVRSLTKLTEVITAALADPLEAAPAATEQTAEAPVAKVKAQRKPKIENAGAALKVKKARATSATIHEKGPRGFKFGPVWLKSIAEGKGVALKPANFPKLKDHAAAAGIEVTADLTQAEIATAIAKTLATA
jgi:hypothetical protein